MVYVDTALPEYFHPMSSFISRVLPGFLMSPLLPLPPSQLLPSPYSLTHSFLFPCLQSTWASGYLCLRDKTVPGETHIIFNKESCTGRPVLLDGGQLTLQVTSARHNRLPPTTLTLAKKASSGVKGGYLMCNNTGVPVGFDVRVIPTSSSTSSATSQLYSSASPSPSMIASHNNNINNTFISSPGPAPHLSGYRPHYLQTPSSSSSSSSSSFSSSNGYATPQSMILRTPQQQQQQQQQQQLSRGTGHSPFLFAMTPSAVGQGHHPAGQQPQNTPLRYGDKYVK